jgi:GT2 family glycosyltransferase
MQHKITASIVVYKNDLRLLQRAVQSFLDSTQESTLYMIDNSPTDEYRTHFNDLRIQYVFNNKNIGFGAGHNIALKDALRKKSTYHIILNPDVYFEESVIEKLYNFMESDGRVGLIMPKVLYPDGTLQPLCKLLPSPLTLFTRRFLKFNTNWTNRLNHWYEMHFSGYDKVMDVPFLSGCFMFLRLEALEKVGMFDEAIFLYTEDADLSRRIHQHYRTVFFPEATIYHFNERGSYKNILILLYHISSAITYFNKWGWFNDEERKFINRQIMLRFSK